MGKSDDTITFRIGELARRLGLNVRTLRYYESIGLLSRPARSGAGYRLYTSADEERLSFVLQAKRVGFSLSPTRPPLPLPGCRSTSVVYCLVCFAVASAAYWPR